MEILLGHLGKGIWLILLLSMPAVLLAAGIGLVVGILQAVTQVQEQTISAAPKIVFVFLLVIFGGPFMMEALQDYTIESVHLGLEVLPRSEPMILPPKPRLAYGEENSRFDFFRETRRPPSTSKMKTLMSKPAPTGDMGTPGERPVRVQSTTPKPKPGPGEQIFLQRRSQGTLPPPPKPSR